MKAYSMDLRKRIFADCDAGMEIRQVAVKYDVSESWIRRLRQRRRETGETAPRPRKKSPAKWLPYAESLQQFISDKPDATLAEVQQQLAIPLSIPTLCRALMALRLTFKKKSSARPNKTARMSRPGARTGGSGKTH